MTRTLTIFGATALLLAVLALPAPADAGHGGHSSGWAFGSGFNVGGFHFRVGYWGGSPGFGQPGFGPGYGRPPGHYYAAPPIHYPGVGCSGACFRTGGQIYHHPSCGVVGHHFNRYGWDPYRTIGRYGPRYRVGAPVYPAPYSYRSGTRHSYPRYERYLRGGSRYERYHRGHSRYHRYDRDDR